jgi:hypothetical protein
MGRKVTLFDDAEYPLSALRQSIGPKNRGRAVRSDRDTAVTEPPKEQLCSANQAQLRVVMRRRYAR